MEENSESTNGSENNLPPEKRRHKTICSMTISFIAISCSVLFLTIIVLYSKRPAKQNLILPEEKSMEKLRYQQQKRDPKQARYWVLVSKAEDLYNLTGYPSGLQINSLTLPIPAEPPRKKGFQATVETLLVPGIISEQWLLFLLKDYLVNLNTMDLNITGLCKGSAVRNQATLENLAHPRLSHVTLEEGNNCQIIKWLLKMETPSLKSLILKNISLNFRTFQPLVQFLIKYGKTLETIELDNCQFSEECNFTQIPEEINEKIKYL